MTPVGTHVTGTPCARERGRSGTSQCCRRGSSARREGESATHEDLGQVLGRRAVGVGRLDDAHLDLVVEAGVLDEVHDEAGDEPGNLVAVEQVEDAVGVGVVEDDAVGVAVERGVALPRHELDVARRALLRLDVVGAAVKVEVARLGRVVAHGDDGQEVVADDLEELLELGRADAVGAVDREGGQEVTAGLGASERGSTPTQSQSHVLFS